MDCILTDTDDDTKAIENQLQKVMQQWNSIAKILKREGANAMTMAKFCMAVAVLLCRAYSWAIANKNWHKLRAFCNKALRYMTGGHVIKKQDKSWEHPCHIDLQWKCRLFDIER